ncbi:[FeFe]-hydrogenase, mitochondrial [Pelomyxa schiedti]|nr:[FeFe]-hydrogenase, mitochondrial [Pelomyxa schiedti]
MATTSTSSTTAVAATPATQPSTSAATATVGVTCTPAATVPATPINTSSAMAQPVQARPRVEPKDHYKFDNEVNYIETHILEEISRMFFAGTLVDEIDRLPISMRPKDSEHASRCCIYRDRAMIRYRIIASLGFAIEDETDELTRLASYATRALARTTDQVVEPVLTVIQEACHKCSRQRYFVTDACQSCIARPCASNCPKAAIDHELGRARINPSLCIKCGICQKSCPYHAIVNIPIPCLATCPVGAITALDDGHKKFDFNKCIFCGNCQRSCPFGAVMPKSQLIDVLKALADPTKKVVALLAPAIVGHCKVDVAVLAAGLVKGLGFHAALDVSVGADLVAQMEATELAHVRSLRTSKGKPDFMTTSCCPAYVNCVKKHIPDLEDAMSTTRSPLHYTGLLAREKYPGCTPVFIGPCVAKRAEALRDPATDFALSFMELFAMIHGRGLDLTTFAPLEGFEVGKREGRGFAVTGGVSGAVKSFFTATSTSGTTVPTLTLINGLNVESVKQLKAYARKHPPGSIVEVMACEGGCVGGPAVLSTVPAAAAKVKVVVSKTPHHPEADQNSATIYIPPPPDKS